MSKISVKNLDLYYGDFKALKTLTLRSSQIRSPRLSDRVVVVNPHFSSRSTV